MRIEKFFLIFAVILLASFAVAGQCDGVQGRIEQTFSSKTGCSDFGLSTDYGTCIYNVSQQLKDYFGYSGRNCTLKVYCDDYENPYRVAMCVKDAPSCAEVGAGKCSCIPLQNYYESCGNCGVKSRQCNIYGTGYGPWSSCTNQGGCSPGQTITRSCGTDTGECRSGTQTITCTNGCSWGSWTGCQGSIRPVTETCDGKDNDCDGRTDEAFQCVKGASGCNDDCTLIGGIPEPVCGNGVKEDGEQCDDGNEISGDGCNSSCILEENYVFLETDKKEICIGEGATRGIEIRLVNNSGKRHCYDFYTDADPELGVSLSPRKNVCVNDGETRTMTLTVNAYSADEDDYNVEIYSCCDVGMFLDVKVWDCGGGSIDITGYGGNLCKGQEEELTVTIENNSDEKKTIYLSAENIYMLPYFSEDKICLDSFEEMELDLTVNAKYAPLGDHDIYLTAYTLNEIVEKVWETEVIDCSSVSGRTFVIDVPNNVFDVSKGEEVESYFTIERALAGCFEEDEIFFSLTGVPSALSQNSVVLDCGEEKTIPFKMFVPDDATVGERIIKLKAYNGSYEVTEEIFVNVLGDISADIFVLTGLKEILRGSSETFKIALANLGDYEDVFEVEITDVPLNVDASLSTELFVIPAGKTETITLTVTPNNNAAFRVASIVVTLKEPIQKKVNVYFKIVHEIDVHEIELLSYPKVINMLAYSEGTYEIILRNNSGRTLNNVEVFFENTPEDINFEKIILEEIQPASTAEATGKIGVGDANGSFSPEIVVKSGSISIRKTVSLNIEGRERPETPRIFTGLFSLEGFDVGPIGVGIFLAALLLATFIFVVLFGGLVGFSLLALLAAIFLAGGEAALLGGLIFIAVSLFLAALIFITFFGGLVAFYVAGLIAILVSLGPEVLLLAGLILLLAILLGMVLLVVILFKSEKVVQKKAAPKTVLAYKGKPMEAPREEEMTQSEFSKKSPKKAKKRYRIV